ncbi:hypothetical protein KUTeg_017323 [Tegillarca granosa]|uniref:Uncharacterized protein n=1 Tax=Tegillarca granosa TaxID=220873 RepID=A0ABQ9EJZ7_TEGGR|nr:hypothetical protein KUTeg_017323 [Tegillarca granosa]
MSYLFRNLQITQIFNVFTDDVLNMSEPINYVTLVHNLRYNKAVSWCTVCNEALCTNCDNYHKVFEALRCHKLCPLEEIQSETRTITILYTTRSEENEAILYGPQTGMLCHMCDSAPP